MPEFEFDPKKNAVNLERHGISLKDAQRLWEGKHVIIPAKNVIGEPRWAIIGQVGMKHYAAIFTERREKTRIISCHRADKRWERIYEKYVSQEK